MTEIRIAEFIYIPRHVLYSDLHPTLLLPVLLRFASGVWPCTGTYSQILGLTEGGYPGEEMQPLTLTELAVTFALLSTGICGCRVRTLRRHLHRLQKKGLVTWSEEAGGTLAVWPLDPALEGG